MKKNIAKTLLSLTTLALLAGCQTTQPNGQPLTPTQVVQKRDSILRMADNGLRELERQNPKIRQEIDSAAGYAVFNATNVNIVLAVLSQGDGVLFENGKPPYFMIERSW